MTRNELTKIILEAHDENINHRVILWYNTKIGGENIIILNPFRQTYEIVEDSFLKINGDSPIYLGNIIRAEIAVKRTEDWYTIEKPFHREDLLV